MTLNRHRNQYFMSSGSMTIGGAIIFLSTVVALQVFQSHYDPIHQHMSELAQGSYGSIMVIGFCGFGLSIFCAQSGLRALGAYNHLRYILVAAAICIVGAGIFKLDNAAGIHVSLIVAAFMLLVVSMYLLPRSVNKFSSSLSHVISWSLAVGTALSVSLGGTIPAGIVQRISAIFILSWLLWVGSVLRRNEAEQQNKLALIPEKKL